MDGYYTHIGLDQPAQYRIKIQGRLERDLSSWFTGEATCAYETGGSDPVTVICGVIVDQSALHGLLNYIRDLGFTLLFADCLTAHLGAEE